MITLPRDWEKNIQFRDWMQPVNQFAEVGVLMLQLINDDNQAWSYQRTVEVSGVDLNQTSNPEKLKEDILTSIYKKICYEIPTVCASQSYAMKVGAGTEPEYEPITNDNWKILLIPDLTIYKEKINA